MLMRIGSNTAEPTAAAYGLPPAADPCRYAKGIDNDDD